MPDEFEHRLVAFAERTMRIKAHCAGEDATRIYLVMPFLELLGYDVGDPSVIVPEHEDLINFAVMVDRRPAIAIETTGAARPPSQAYSRLHAYCEAVGTVKLGMATNGVLFDAFIDCDRPGMFEPEPFLRIDIAQIAAGGVDRQTLGLLQMMCAATYNPEGIAEQAFAINLRERLKARVLEEFRTPSEAFCRLLLEQIGVRNPKAGVIDQHYRPILKTAMEQAIIVPVLQVLRQLPSPPAAEPAPMPAAEAVGPRGAGRTRDVTSERLNEEVAAFGRLKRRSA
jgi:predicted type IV restriction endonuclease